MVLNHPSHIAKNIPRCERQQRLDDALVPHPVEAGLGEAADAVNAVDEHDGEANGEVEDGVKDEFVEVADDEKVDDEELERHVEDLDVGVHVHLLMRDDGSVVGCLGDAEHGAEDAALINPVGGGHAAGGDDELVAKEPQSDSLGKHQNNEGDADVDNQRAGEGGSEAVGWRPHRPPPIPLLKEGGLFTFLHVNDIG